MRSNRDAWLLVGSVSCALACAAAVAMLVRMRFELANPEWLLAASCFLPIIALALWRMQRKPSLTRLSVLTDRMPKRMSPRVALRALPFAALCGGVALLLIALARPQAEDSSEEHHSEGIDIVIALDVSGSMLARDLKPDRLEAAKRVAMDFIDGRPNDRIGLVVYEGDAFTQCPLTTDHSVLKTLFTEARSGFIANGTAVGMGLATAVNRLRHSEAKSKVVILLTDGVNNTGAVQPLDAAMLADRMGIRVYTIGLGTRGKALSPVGRYPDGSLHFDYVEVDLDEKTLQAISAATGGRSFRATDERKLKEIYNEIDRLEKTRFKVEHFSYKVEKYHRLALWGILLVLGSFLSEKLLFRSMT